MPWILRPANDLAAVASRWDALERATSATPFLQTAFLLPLLECFGTGQERLALLEEGGQLRTGALLRPLGMGRWETFQPSQLPLGPWICAPGTDATRCFDDLCKALPGLALSVGVTQLDPKLLPRPADAGGLKTLDYVKTSWVDIEGDFEQYWESRGKNLRQNVRKQRSKLEADGVSTSLECVTAPGDVAAAMADYGALESAGWKAQQGTAIHPDNAQGRFYTRMLERLCSQGQGRIYRYRFDDRVVAMDLCIDEGPLVVILKTAYDESYKQISPSTLMRKDQFRAWWAEGRYRRVEFYGKTLEWHTRWTSSERMLYHATRFRWPWLQRLGRGGMPVVPA